MRARSLSLRLTIVSIAAVALAVLLFGIAARVVIGDRMHASLDDSLRQRATDVARLARLGAGAADRPGRARIAGLRAPAERRGARPRRRDRRPLALARREAAAAGARDRRRRRRASTGFADAELGGEPIRVFAAPIAEVGGPASGGVVLVASSTADIEDTQHRLGLLLLLCGAGAVLVGGVAAALLTRRSTRPLRELSSSAATIERTEDPSRRLAEPAGPEEIARAGRRR